MISRTWCCRVIRECIAFFEIMGNQVECEVKSINKINNNIMTFAKQAMYYTNIQYFIDIAVAPRAGAWIETIFGSRSYRSVTSHPVRVRGLKQ